MFKAHREGSEEAKVREGQPESSALLTFVRATKAICLGLSLPHLRHHRSSALRLQSHHWQPKADPRRENRDACLACGTPVLVKPS